MENASTSSAQEVFVDHLYQGKYGTMEEEFARNYAEDVILPTSHGIYRGYEGLRQLARRLREELPDATFEYHTALVEGEVAFLEWTTHSVNAGIDDGADAYIIRDGRIVAQTVHYTINPLCG